MVLASVVLQLALQYRLNYWSRDFFDAFGRRDGSALSGQALLFVLLAGSSIVVAMLAIWARMMTQIRWRAWLTRHLINRWLANDRFLHLPFLLGEDRNPEYRIAEDARVATDAPVSMATGLLTALLNVVMFVSILWNVGGDLVIEIRGHVLTVPKYLVITVVLYSALLTLTISIIGRRMVHVIAGKNSAEAQFRSTAASLRESRGLGTGDAQGRHRRLSAAFDTVVSRYRDLCFQFVRTTLVSHGNLLAAPITLRTKIRGRHHVAWRGRAGGCRLRDGANVTRLAGRQLSRPGRMPVLCEPGWLVAHGTG